MKKIGFIFLILLLLTGCSNSVNLNFENEINTTINLNFSLTDYKKYHSDIQSYDDYELKSQIDAIRNDREAFSTGNSELFNEKKYEESGNNYFAIYDYNYTYSNFKYNMVLNSCFEYFLVDEDDKAIYISLSGKSICAPFELNVTAPNRMIKNNAASKSNNKYTWKINYDSNDIYMAISKNKLDSPSSLIYLLYFGIIILFTAGAYFIRKKKINNV